MERKEKGIGDGVKSLLYLILWVAGIMLAFYIGIKADVAYTKWKYEQIITDDNLK